MVRLQIQLPDALYERAKRAASARELSLTEVARRGLELLLDRYPDTEPASLPWRLPQVGGQLTVRLEDLRDLTTNENELRGRSRK
jgi:hypothetical protein